MVLETLFVPGLVEASGKGPGKKLYDWYQILTTQYYMSDNSLGTSSLYLLKPSNYPLCVEFNFSHNLEAVGSSPTAATRKVRGIS